MKIVCINDAPSVRNENGTIRADVTDIGKILVCLDQACGRNDAVRAYIYALRDLQRANDEFAMGPDDESAIGAEDDSAIVQAEAAVKVAFDALVVAEHSLNRRET